MSCVIIYPGLPLPTASSDPPKSVTGSHIAFCSVLLRMGFTCARPVTSAAVVSYTAFPPLPAPQAVYLCCTVPGVASAGRYPASCPVKPGLSSPGPFRSCQPRLHILLCQKRNIRQLIIISQTFSVVHPPNHRSRKAASHTSKQLPPTNSRRIEFFGISSIGTPTK